MPISENPNEIKYGTYVAGFDGYKVSTSKTTDSVGAFYIYKRTVGITGFQDQLVVSYASRPNQVDVFYDQCLLLLEKYNAEVLPESDPPFQDYMKRQGKLHKYFANCTNLAKTINENTNAILVYGLPQTQNNKDHIMKLVNEYVYEKVIVGYDDNKDPIYNLGVTRINDLMLLEELEKFKDNYDRIIAFGHALAWANELKNRGITGGEREVKPNAAEDWIKGIQNYRRKSKYSR